MATQKMNLKRLRSARNLASGMLVKLIAAQLGLTQVAATTLRNLLRAAVREGGTDQTAFPGTETLLPSVPKGKSAVEVDVPGAVVDAVKENTVKILVGLPPLLKKAGEVQYNYSKDGVTKLGTVDMSKAKLPNEAEIREMVEHAFTSGGTSSIQVEGF